MDLKYKPDKFAQDYAKADGQKLWKVLNDDSLVARMETASDLDQPALKPLEDLLLAEFGERMLNDRFKQMTGHMVRQIMESRGFVHDASDIKLNSVPFYKASRYRRAQRDALYLFRCSTDPYEIGLTDERKGDKLPEAPKGGRWMFVNTVSSPLKAGIGYGFDLKTAVAEVKKKSFFRHRISRVLRAG